MHGIRKLGLALGDNALQQYCRKVFLNQFLTEEVKDTKFLEKTTAPGAEETGVKKGLETPRNRGRSRKKDALGSYLLAWDE